MFSTSNAILVLLVLGTLTEAKSCNKNLFALPDWKRVRSPNYPSRFAPQTQCTWRITSPLSYRIQLELTDFSLVPPDNDNKCVSQWLNIIEGGIKTDIDGGQPPMLTLCGTNKPRLIISTGSILKLNLHSDSDATDQPYRGFSARFKYTDEEPYMPDISNELPATAFPRNGGSSQNQRKMSGVSIGDIINPHIKPKPLPPNPNAVKTLQNRRTEARNRARNDQVANDNNAQNNRRGGPPPLAKRKPPPGYGRPLIPNSQVMDEDNRISQQDLPPKRTKPLSREVVILISVLGTVAAIVLIIYLLKRFVYDKRKKSEKGIHAYAHFRKFKKKGKGEGDGDEKDTKINTIASTLPDGNSTMNSKYPGYENTNEVKNLENGFVHERGQEQITITRAKTMQSTRCKEQVTRDPPVHNMAQEKTKAELEILHMPRPEAEGTSTSDSLSEDDYYRPSNRRYRRKEQVRGAAPERRHRRRGRGTTEARNERSDRSHTRTDDSSDDVGISYKTGGERNRRREHGDRVSRRPREERDRRKYRRSRSRTDLDNEKRRTWRDRTYH